MKTLYIDCRMGVSGAKLMGAFVDVLEEPEKFVYEFNHIGIEGVSVRRAPEAMKGIAGTELQFSRTSHTELEPYADEMDDEDVTERKPPKRTRRTLGMVKDIICGLGVSAWVKEKACEAYDMIAEVGSVVYEKNVENVILRRTGSRDVIASVVGAFMALERLAPEKIVASNVSVGMGYVRTPRGKIPVPTPELSRLIGTIPHTAGEVEGEIASLEGVAILKVLDVKYDSIPEMNPVVHGAGFGIRPYARGINCVKVSYGEETTTASDGMIELSAEIYDTSDKEILEIKKLLCEMGAKMVMSMIITDCDGKFGYLLKCIAREDEANKAASAILENTRAEMVLRSSVGIYKK